MTEDVDPLVSVVMIFRDAGEFLDEAVASVLAQDHPRVELLLVDDGSVDGTRAVAARHAGAHGDRVRLITYGSGGWRGMAAARTFGIAHANGDLVAFLDSDDVWGPSHLSDDVALLQRSPTAGMVCGRALKWRTWDGADAVDTWSPLPFCPETLVPPPEMLIAILRRGEFTTPTCSFLIWTRLLRDVGGAPDQFSGIYEDQALFARLYLQLTAVISGSLTAKYRQHTSSATSVAVREGRYDPANPNPAREMYLRWLDTLPEVASPDANRELRQALDLELEACGPVHRSMSARAGAAARRMLPSDVRHGLRRFHPDTPRPGRARYGSLRRLTPMSRQFGFDRGQPVDRWYIERFLAQNALAIRGRVLEVGDATYTRRFGGDRVISAEVLNIAPGDPATTYVADLADGKGLPDDTFDCVVLTQVLHLVFDIAAAVRNLHRVLRPGGTTLVTVPGISPLSDDVWAANWYWAVTPVAALRLFSDVFGSTNVEVQGHGNVLASTAFLHGLAADELRPAELVVNDPQFPLVVTVRAFKPRTSGTSEGLGIQSHSQLQDAGSGPVNAPSMAAVEVNEGAPRTSTRSS